MAERDLGTEQVKLAAAMWNYATVGDGKTLPEQDAEFVYSCARSVINFHAAALSWQDDRVGNGLDDVLQSVGADITDLGLKRAILTNLGRSQMDIGILEGRAYNIYFRLDDLVENNS